jgi:hypothetical protein
MIPMTPYEQQQCVLMFLGFILGGYHSLKVTGTILSMTILSPIYMLFFALAYKHITGN